MKPKTVRYTFESRPPRTAADQSRLRAGASQPRSKIDFSDIPEWSAEDFRNAVRGRFYRPLKKQITAKVDADILQWLKSEGKGYQSRMNAILRREMLAALGESKAA